MMIETPVDDVLYKALRRHRVPLGWIESTKLSSSSFLLHQLEGSQRVGVGLRLLAVDVQSLQPKQKVNKRICS